MGSPDSASQRRGGKECRWKAQESALVVSAFPDQIKKVRSRLEHGRKAKNPKETKEESKTDSTDSEDQKKDNQPPLKVTPVVARRAAEAVDSLLGPLRDWFCTMSGFQPNFSSGDRAARDGGQA